MICLEKSAKTIHTCSYSWRFSFSKVEFLLNYRPYFLSLMLLLYFKILIISQRLSKFATSSYRLQGHEGRSVRFTTCVKDEILNASCKLHRPVFMTLEPIRWLCSFAEKLRNDEYVEVQQQHHQSGNKHTTWHESNSFG